MTANKPPIFIVGSGRSGTTVLRSIMNAHPNIYISHEAAYYMYDKRPPRKRSGGMTLAYYNKLYDRRVPDLSTSGAWLELYMKSFSFNWLKLDPEAVRQRVPADLPIAQLGQVFETLMQMMAEKYGKTRYGDKTPMYCMRLDRILSDFPTAKIVHIIRDPRPTVASMVRMPWMSYNLRYCSDYIAAQADAVEHFKDRVLEIRLEDLLSALEPTMRKVLEFVDEPWSDQVLNFTEYAPLNDMPPYPWFIGATKPLQPEDASKSAAWQRQFSPQQIKVIEYINRNTMRRFGYQPMRFDNPPSWLSWQWCYLAESATVSKDTRRWTQVMDQMMSGRAPRGHLLLWQNDHAWRHYPEFDVQAVMDWEDDR